jgi:hypothetical protein
MVCSDPKEVYLFDGMADDQFESKHTLHFAIRAACSRDISSVIPEDSA